MPHLSIVPPEPSKVVRSFVLSDCPGWLVREYASGKVDAVELRGVGLSPGFDSISEAIDYVRGVS